MHREMHLFSPDLINKQQNNVVFDDDDDNDGTKENYENKRLT